jgi:hypothetical protein
MFLKQTCVYKAVNDCQVRVDVYRTPGDVARPAILWPHGGR